MAFESVLAKIEAKAGITGYEVTSCDLHGDYKAARMGTGNLSRCPECVQAEADKAARDEHKRDRMEARIGRALIPKRFALKTFDGYTVDNQGQAKALATCKDYADRFDLHHADGRCLLLLGKAGTGKTHLAASVANQVMRTSQKTCMYRTLPDLLADLRGTYGSGSDTTEAEIFSVVSTVDLLILDEIGATKATEFELATLFRVINSRYEDLLPTIVISNLGPQQIPEAMGDRCVDRLRESGGIAVVFDWESHRSKKPN